MKLSAIALLLFIISCNSTNTMKNEKENKKTTYNNLTRMGLHGKVKRMVNISSFDIHQKFGEWVPKDSAWGLIHIMEFDQSGNITTAYGTSLKQGDTTTTQSIYKDGKYIGMTIFHQNKKTGGSKAQWLNDSTLLESIFDTSGKTQIETKIVYGSNGLPQIEETSSYDSLEKITAHEISHYQYSNNNSLKSLATEHIGQGSTDKSSDTVDFENLQIDKVGNVLKRITLNHSDRSPKFLNIYSYEYY